MALTRDQQLFSLCRMVTRRVLEWMLGVCIASAIVLVGAGVQSAWPPYFMIAVFLAFVALAVWQTAPHVRRAWQAVKAPERCHDATIEIEVESDSDSTTYHARVPAENMGAWRFQFRPQGWKPVAGRLEGDVRYIADVRWPVLVVAPAGILVPCHEPRRIASSSAGTNNWVKVS
jgi:hypothetical protein